MKTIFVLFISLITLAATAQAKLSLDTNRYDFGSMKEGDRVAHTFIVTNTGTTPLVLINITTPCGCTIPEFTKEPIPAGKTGAVKIIYDSQGHPGVFDKMLQIQSNDPAKYHEIYISGEVMEKTTGQNTAE